MQLISEYIAILAIAGTTVLLSVLWRLIVKGDKELRAIIDEVLDPRTAIIRANNFQVASK